jgi:hypothetical protein
MAVPGKTLVTVPEVISILAIVASLLLHVPPNVASDRVVVSPDGHRLVVPDIADTALTVNTVVAVPEAAE